MPRLAVLGQPISHSRSPAMQTAALAELGLAREWSYEAIEVAPDAFEARVRAMAGEGFAGANVTVPHKLAALALADRASEAARAIGAANTLSFEDGAIAAENTDAEGILAALPSSPEGMRALVLGAGGSGRAAVWALRSAGAEVSVWNRTRSRAEALAGELGVELAEADPAVGGLRAADFDLLLNATTIGLAAASGEPGDADDEPDLKAFPLDADAVRAEHVVVDLAYGRLPTPLVRIARERGAEVVDGLEVLVHQGAAALRIWTGKDPPLEVMREAARED